MGVAEGEAAEGDDASFGIVRYLTFRHIIQRNFVGRALFQPAGARPLLPTICGLSILHAPSGHPRRWFQGRARGRAVFGTMHQLAEAAPSRLRQGVSAQRLVGLFCDIQSWR